MNNVKGNDSRYWMLDARFAGMTDKAGSALILTVVLTSLLAIIGIMFVMAANMDRISTSSVSVNKELQFAVDSVVAQISQQLILDVPGVAGQEYYDYPAGNVDPWLASLEPDNSNNWQHISDLYVEWSLPGINNPDIIPEHQVITGIGTAADADGDGVADSRWTELRTSPAAGNQPVYTKSGKRIYTAIRVIDNGAMLNVNTGYRFYVDDPNLVDGSSQLHINLLGLAGRPVPSDPASEALNLWKLRVPNHTGSQVNRSDLDNYQRDVVWHYYKPDGDYTPFDISDELAMRNRFLLKRKNLLTQTDVQTRLENWGGEFMSTIWTPVDDSTAFDKWHERVYDNGSPDPNYAYRHIATTYNMDRIIDPNGRKMVNINDDSADLIADLIYEAIAKALRTDATFTDPNETAAQITANLIDYRDSDSDITEYTPPPPAVGGPYYGFERPCIYISELAYKLASWPDPVDPINNPPIVARSYAIELFKPYDGDVYPDAANQNWRLLAGSQNVTINNWTSGSYHVVIIEDPTIVNPGNACTPNTIEADVDIAASRQNWTPGIDLRNIQIELQREVPAGSNNYITVDSTTFPNPGDPAPNNCISQSRERDIDPDRCIRHLWEPTEGNKTLGTTNEYNSADFKIQAHPANELFTNVGQIGMIFRKSAYPHSGVFDFITNTDTEADVRVNLAVDSYQRIFDYLTVFDPSSDTPINNDDDDWTDETEPDRTPEFKIPGRININTAPWYVIAQLPWMQYDTASTSSFVRAQAICTDRDNNIGFTSVGELMRVQEMRELDSDTQDNLYTDPTEGPDLTTDTSQDDFEERDVIFSRISNLVTVRSDVFTAYILVRLGPDGPQKRVIALLDRSDVYPNTSGSGATGKVKIVALWPVPDSR